MSASIPRSILILLCSTLAGAAQGTTPDFTTGFKQLAALGLPALDAKATWVKHPHADNNSYDLREMAKSVKGNAWLAATDAGNPSIIPFGGIEAVDSDPNEKKASLPRGTPQDLAKDTASLIAALKKAAAKRDSDEYSSYSSYSSRGDSSIGKFLLFATQLYQTGHADLANQLALAVFELFPAREVAVDAAIDLIGDHFYQQACRAFFSSGDWAAYHQSLTALGKRFPRGWASRDAITIFLPQLEKQAAGAKAPVPALPDTPIDPRALEIIRELTEKSATKPDAATPRNLTPAMRYRMRMMGDYEGGDSGPNSLWLISEANDTDKKNPSPLARLAALKLAAIPALAALTSDPFLTHQPTPRSYSGYHSSSESSDERALRIYHSINRPSTRGELAIQLLSATLPNHQDQSSFDSDNQPDPDALRELALTFWKEHKSATREELAVVFLREGSRQQASLAAAILAASSEPKGHAAFEAHALAADPAIAEFQNVQNYLRTRKTAAKPFFEAYAKLVRSQSKDAADESDDSRESSWQVKQAGGVEKILKQLETLIGGQSPRTLAVQIAKGKPADAEAAIKSLSSLLADATPTKHLHALLEGANATTDASIRARFLSAAMSIPWGANDGDDEGDPGGNNGGNNGGDPDEDEEPVPNKPASERKISEPEAVVWRKLIADTRKLPKEFNRYLQGGNDSTIANQAAIALEYSISSNNARAAYQASPIINRPVATILMEQATARLAGKPVPPLPDASKISSDRLAEIVAEAAKKQPAEIHPYLTSLTPDERAAWFKWFNSPGDLPYPDSVKQQQFTIVARSPSGNQGAPDVPGAGNLDVGFQVTPENLTKHIESLAADIDKHSRTDIQLYPAPFGPGLQIAARVIPLPSAKSKRALNRGGYSEDGDSMPYLFSNAIKTLDANPNASAIAEISLRGEGSRSQACWLIQNGKAALQAPSAANDDEKDPFASALKNALESKPGFRFQLQIQFLSRADATKFSTPPADEDEDESPEPHPEEP